MKHYIIIAAFLCFCAINLFAAPNNSSARVHSDGNSRVASSPENTKTETAKSSAAEWWLVIIVALTGAAIAYQAKEMVRAREVMERSTKAAERSTEATEKTIALLEKQGVLMERQLEEMRASTNAAINKDRGKVHISVSRMKFYPGEKCDVEFMLRSSGDTKIFVDDFRVLFTKTENAEIVPSYAQCIQFDGGGREIPDANCAPYHGIVVRPDGTLTDNETAHIRNGKLFLHFYGFVQFRDIFEHKRQRNIHVRWSGMPEEEIDEWHWQKVGPAEENSEVEEK